MYKNKLMIRGGSNVFVNFYKFILGIFSYIIEHSIVKDKLFLLMQNLVTTNSNDSVACMTHNGQVLLQVGYFITSSP